MKERKKYGGFHKCELLPASFTNNETDTEIPYRFFFSFYVNVHRVPMR